jgi:hypothetical protein
MRPERQTDMTRLIGTFSQLSVEKGKNVKLSLCSTNKALRHEGVLGSECIDPYFLDLGTSWSASGPCRFTPGERASGTHWTGGWVGPRAGLDDLGKRKCFILPELELRPLSHPARSQLLIFRLRTRQKSVILLYFYCSSCTEI